MSTVVVGIKSPTYDLTMVDQAIGSGTRDEQMELVAQLVRNCPSKRLWLLDAMLEKSHCEGLRSQALKTAAKIGKVGIVFRLLRKGSSSRDITSEKREQFFKWLKTEQPGDKNVQLVEQKLKEERVRFIESSLKNRSQKELAEFVDWMLKNGSHDEQVELVDQLLRKDSSCEEQIQLVEWMIERSEFSKDLLFLALTAITARGNVRMVVRLLKRGDFREKVQFVEWLLKNGSRDVQFNFVEQLLQSALLDDPMQLKALLLAIVKGADPAIVEWLKRRGIDYSQESWLGALIEAAKCGRGEMIKHLLENPYSNEGAGQTPGAVRYDGLRALVASSNKKTFKLLLSRDSMSDKMLEETVLLAIEKDDRKITGALLPQFFARKKYGFAFFWGLYLAFVNVLSLQMRADILRKNIAKLQAKTLAQK